MSVQAPSVTEPIEANLLAQFAKAVIASPDLTASLWIELVPAIEVRPEAIGASGKRSIAIGTIQFVISETEDGQEIISLRGQGVRVTSTGEVDGRSRPVMYDLPADWTHGIAEAIADRPRFEQSIAEQDADTIWQAAGSRRS